MCCPMSPQQEEGYRLFCAQKILRYSIGFLIIIAAIQVYNIAYVLVYTHGRLQSVPSRVYMRMYVIMLLLTAVGLCLCFFFQKRLPQHVRGVLYFQVVYSVLILAWCAGITVYDQRVSQNISVYLITAMTLSIVACFTPLQAITIYGVFLAVVCGTLPMFQPGQIDNHSSYINLTVMSVMSAFICCYRYYQERRHYLEQQLIEEQNRRLEELACHDSLTRLRNRRFLEEQMEKIYADCIREGKALTVMMLDIDHFKDYNDTYGHLQGDECLRRVAWRLEQELQPQFATVEKNFCIWESGWTAAKQRKKPRCSIGWFESWSLDFRMRTCAPLPSAWGFVPACQSRHRSGSAILPMQTGHCMRRKIPDETAGFLIRRMMRKA